MKRTARLASFPLLALALLVTACPSDEPGGEGSSGSSGDASSSTGVDPGATSVVSASGSTSTSGTTNVDPDTSGGLDSVGFLSGGSTSDGPLPPQPNGAECFDPEDCESGFCLTFMGGGGGGGGVCSECEMDTDCDEGTCGFSFDVGYAVCTDGSAGSDCDSTRGCADDLVCAPVLEADGFALTRCSECGPKTPCEEGQTCSLNLASGLFQAYNNCVETGMVPLGDGCPVTDGVGDGSVCMSGECGVALVFMGTVELGICSDCDTDEDCAEGETCTPPDFEMGVITPGSCG